ncbi:MAG: hypothetical protein N3B11_03775, partial [Coriobacteriia bacterium]|nr:hypothetical protein [Coriobacteriia bacterium]
EARPLDFSLDLSAFGDTGWEKSAILRVSPSRIELLLKPDPDAPETERLMPRMALNRRDGRACVPDVSQHERITPHGRHVFVVWESQAGERSDEELASPLRAQVWFSRRA